MYIALYRKYRPQTFEDVISQPHITKTLKNEIINNKIAHAYLFTGPRGTGKTTCARTLAMAMNCKNPVDGNPCLECENCKAILDGTTMDVVEIDAASNNGVDNIRDLREEATYTPSMLKYRVYIIDETHMLSASAFNALLKIMEEPPEHVKFILATTEAHKVPETILSRCQRFDFRRVITTDIEKRILEIANKEDFTLSAEAASLIAHIADGGMRDALSLLDQCAAYDLDITEKTVSMAAGVAEKDDLYKTIEAIAEKETAKIIEIIDKIYSGSKDVTNFINELVMLFRNLMIIKTTKSPEKQVDVSSQDIKKLAEFSEKFTLSEILFVISELQACLEKIQKSYDKRMTIELSLIKLSSPDTNSNSEDLLKRVTALENIINSGSITLKQQETAPKKEKTVIRKQEPIIAEPEKNIDTAETVEDIPQDVAQSTEKKPVPKTKAQPIVCDFWNDILAELTELGNPLSGVLVNSMAHIMNGAIYITTASPMAVTMLKREGFSAKLIEVIENKTGVKYKILARCTQKEDKKETAENKLNDILNNAKNLGVEINKE